MALFVGFMIPVELFVSGVVVSYLWAWFVASTFNLPEISISQAAGISILVACLTFRTGNKGRAEGNAEETIERQLVNIIAALMFWGLGWVVHCIAG